MLNLNSIMIGTSQPQVMGEFYEKVLGKKSDMAEEGWYGFQIGNCFLTIGEHSEVNGEAKEPQRMILNLETKDVRGEFERIKKAVPDINLIKEPYEMEGWENGLIATFADPDGNYFQLMSPWEENKE